MVRDRKRKRNRFMRILALNPTYPSEFLSRISDFRLLLLLQIAVTSFLTFSTKRSHTFDWFEVTVATFENRLDAVRTIYGKHYAC
mmetsp:Transcript_15680/g.17704  ORF Transcript_15680/g.17704 Transcript_15680/m.17704 type:complete len:85 (+) Transcript_15680:24-278(+)